MFVVHLHFLVLPLLELPEERLWCPMSYVMFCPGIIALGLIVACTPSLCGKLFSQNRQLYTISTINCGGYLSNGNEAAILLTLFYCSYVPFDFCYVFVGGTYVQYYALLFN